MLMTALFSREACRGKIEAAIAQPTPLSLRARGLIARRMPGR
jgi:hypothetical protein